MTICLIKNILKFYGKENKNEIRIPFINRWLIIAKDYPSKESIDFIFEFETFPEFRKRLKEVYHDGMWTEDISLILNDIDQIIIKEIKEFEKGETI